MSQAYRLELQGLFQDATFALENTKQFALPIKGPTQSDNQFCESINAILSDLSLESQNICELTDDLSKTHNNWMSLRSSMTGPERLADNTVFDQFVAQYPYIETLNHLKQYKRQLRSAQRILEGALPPVSAQSASHAHIPRMALPTFYGKSAEFLSFWNQFNASIGKLSTLSDAVKLSYLKSCLSGPPLSLIESLPLTDASYGQAVHLLETKFNNSDEIVRSLYQSIKALPTIRKGEFLNADLASLTDGLEAILIQFSQHNSDPNVPSIHMDIEAKLPPFLLEEIYRTKETMAGHWTCLQAGHNFRDCPKPSTCRKCQGNHPRPLCNKIFSKSNTNQNVQFTPSNSAPQARNNANHGNKRFNNYVTENPAKNNNQITLPVSSNTQGPSNEIGLELKRADEFSAHALQQTPANSISTLSSIAYPFRAYWMMEVPILIFWLVLLKL
uniref:Uncharacterized protein n=1 Tax=Meloidogyne incognita TaxID=6306 RepID=A0A914M220_MELIC